MNAIPDDVIDALRDLPDGPWEVWTSCSFRRISAKGDGDVLCGTIQRSDGHPDLSMKTSHLKHSKNTAGAIVARPDF